MNIEKVKTYNQKLLAVLGTLAAVFLVVCMLVTLVVFIMECMPNQSGRGDGLLSDDKVEILNQDNLRQQNLRQQIVSYNLPQLVDTVNSIYVITTGLQTLDKSERVGKLNFSSGSHEYSSLNGVNLLIFDAQTGEVQPLFSQRVLIQDFEPYYFKDDILLFFHYVDSDTDKDGMINFGDYENLGIYSLKTKFLHKIAFEKSTILDCSFLVDTGKTVSKALFTKNLNMLVTFGVDRNEDGHYQRNNEPSVIKRYDFQTHTLTDIIPQDIQNELQRLVEGKTQ
ncbi:MAG: hypothetical protein LBU62_01530 [Bacteroidales bacterium]|jgi:hypothetical protein|nr:hypothetical protein [Bacteroidales bacterium]